MNLFSQLGIRLQEQYTHPVKPDELLERFRTGQKARSFDGIIRIVNNSIFIKVPPGTQKWWSPELTVSIEENNEGSGIKEVTGPTPGTFTLAMFIITGAIVIFFFALMFAFSQIQLGLSPFLSVLVIVGASVIALLVLVILGIGRRKAKPQMKVLKDFVREALNPGD